MEGEAGIGIEVGDGWGNGDWGREWGWNGVGVGIEWGWHRRMGIEVGDWDRDGMGGWQFGVGNGGGMGATSCPCCPHLRPFHQAEGWVLGW